MPWEMGWAGAVLHDGPGPMPIPGDLFGLSWLGAPAWVPEAGPLAVEEPRPPKRRPAPVVDALAPVFAQVVKRRCRMIDWETKEAGERAAALEKWRLIALAAGPAGTLSAHLRAALDAASPRS